MATAGTRLSFRDPPDDCRPTQTAAAGSFMNLTMTIALYAAICKEQGLPFRCVAVSAVIQSRYEEA